MATESDIVSGERPRRSKTELCCLLLLHLSKSWPFSTKNEDTLFGHLLFLPTLNHRVHYHLLLTHFNDRLRAFSAFSIKTVIFCTVHAISNILEKRQRIKTAFTRKLKADETRGVPATLQPTLSYLPVSYLNT